MSATSPHTNGTASQTPTDTAAQSHKGGLVTIIVPAKDEAAAIGETLRALPIATLEAMGFTVETIVLDGHSHDGTPDIARAEGATVIPDEAEGNGSAVRKARPMFHGDYVVMLDADGSYAADAIPRVLEPLAWGQADVVMGDRRPLPGAMSGLHKVGNVLLSAGASTLYGHRCPDLCTGLWAFRADVLQAMPLESCGFELEAELFALSSRMHLRIAHIQADYMPRAGTTKLSATRDGARIGWCLVRSRFRSISRTSRPSTRPKAPSASEPPVPLSSKPSVPSSQPNGATRENETDGGGPGTDALTVPVPQVKRPARPLRRGHE